MRTITLVVLVGIVTVAVVWCCFRTSDAAVPSHQGLADAGAGVQAPVPPAAPVRVAPSTPPAEDRLDAKKGDSQEPRNPEILRADTPNWVKVVARECQLTEAEAASLVRDPGLLAR